MIHSRRPLLIARHLLVPMLLVFVVGCVNQQRRTPVTPPRQVEADRSHLHQLIEQRRQVRAEVAQLEQKLHEFRLQNPDLNWPLSLAKQRTMQINKALTAAEVESIEARSKFGSGHPELRSRIQRLEELQALYEQALQHAKLLNAQAAEYQALKSELAEQRDLLRSLDGRIERLEDQIRLTSRH